MPQTATIKSLPAAFRMMKAMQAEGVEWGEDDRGAARHALAAVLEGRMDQLIDVHLERMAEFGQADPVPAIETILKLVGASDHPRPRRLNCCR